MNKSVFAICILSGLVFSLPLTAQCVLNKKCPQEMVDRLREEKRAQREAEAKKAESLKEADLTAETTPEHE